MLTVEEIQSKVKVFPKDKPVRELLDELALLYKIEMSLQEAEAGKGLPLDAFNKELEAWWKSK